MKGFFYFPSGTGQKPQKNKRIHRQSGAGRCGYQGRGTRQNIHLYGIFPGEGHQLPAWVGNAGGAPVGNQRHCFSQPQPVHGLGKGAVAVLVVAEKFFGHAVMVQQGERAAGVFAENGVGFLKRVKRPESDVFKVSYGGGDDIEHDGL